jgi:hypothetical protein
MKEAIEVSKTVHQGKNVKRIREILGIKKDTSYSDAAHPAGCRSIGTKRNT